MANVNDYVWTDPNSGKATRPGVGNAALKTGGSTDTGGMGDDYDGGSQRLTLEEAQAQANQAFSGLVAPMTTEEINAREEAAKAGTLATAESIYDPNIQREKQTGASQVSTATGVVGQRQGFNISTAEQAFVADVQNKVQDRVREVENIKASYISQGNLDAADRADAQLQQLNEWNSQMTIAKANYALQLMAGNREEASLALDQARFGLEEKSQEFNQSMAEDNLAISIAQLTGDYDGDKTLAAKQADISNALATAGLTGDYDGTETLAAKTARLNNELALMGYELDERQLEEVIRSNAVQEGLSYARLNADEDDTSPSGIVMAAANRLNDLKGTAGFNDLAWEAEVKNIADAMGYQGDGSEADNAILAKADQNMKKALTQLDPNSVPEPEPANLLFGGRGGETTTQSSVNNAVLGIEGSNSIAQSIGAITAEFPNAYADLNRMTGELGAMGLQAANDFLISFVKELSN